MRLGETTHRRLDEELSTLLTHAEHNQSCCFGMTRSHRYAFSTRQRKRTIISPFPRLFARKDYWSMLRPNQQILHIIRGLSQLRPHTIFCDTSAAAVYGLPVSFTYLKELHTCATNRSHGRRVVCHHVRHRMHARVRKEFTTFNGIRVTSPVCTVFDCARKLPFPHALAVADAALHNKLITSRQLQKYVSAHPRVHGIRRARMVAQYADGRAESGGESILRARMIELGYEIPNLKVPITDPVDGRRTYRADMLIRTRNNDQVIIEMDGKEKIINPHMLKNRSSNEALLDEHQRESRLTAYGLRFLRIRYKDLLDTRKLRRLFDRFEIPKSSNRRVHSKRLLCQSVRHHSKQVLLNQSFDRF